MCNPCYRVSKQLQQYDCHSKLLRGYTDTEQCHYKGVLECAEHAEEKDVLTTDSSDIG